LPPIPKSGSYPTYAHKSDCGATWSECGDTAQILSAEGKVAVPEKIGSEKPASIAAGIPPAALLVGQKPEPTYGEPPLPIVPPHSPYGQEVQLSARRNILQNGRKGGIL